MSIYTPLESGNEGAQEEANNRVKEDTSSQITLLNAVDSDAEYDDTTVWIWNQRYDSVPRFAVYMQYCISLGWKECISQSKWHWFAVPRTLHDMELFDLASRSAWGSFRLLYFFARQGICYIAIVGAFAMVMVSLTGFFLQQLVQFQDCLQPNATEYPPRVSKTNSYMRSGAIAALNSSTSAEPFMGMVAAVNVAIFQPTENYTNMLSQRCISGHCTFPMANGTTFSTVAVSHKCEDLTRQASTSRSTFSPAVVSLRDEIGTLIELDLHSDTIITTRTDPRIKESLSSLSTIYIINRLLSVFTPEHQALSASSSDFEILKCSLFPTLNTYGASITKSLLNETLIESIPLEPYEPRKSGNISYAFLTASNNTLRNGIQQLCEPSTGDKRTHIEYKKSNEADNDTLTSLYYPNDCVWGFGESAANGIRHYFSKILDNQTLTLTELRESTYASMHLRQLWQNETMLLPRVQNIMEDLSKAMSAVVRTNGEEGAVWYLEGTMFSTTTCVDIEWAWLTFPIVTVVLTGVFLAFMVWDNRDIASDRLWKSSILAALFCEVEHARIDETQTICKEAMIEMAKSTSVSVEGGKGTLKFVARQ
ncbi:hypothetical protein OPT61_g1748 [Boeremia exigua]|uniref:Uncharacterized protein n=1 Tax=Boeremia exigua TaxID=749465 RepID=A0ACC2IP86_9PLEO|nr:hypothetical protein OPT61_g1748 [Boeremia exigua]